MWRCLQCVLAGLGVAVLAACAGGPTRFTETAEAIVIEAGPGGPIDQKARVYGAFSRSGKKLVVDGPVASADAFYAFAIPGVCYTARAVFQPHAARGEGLGRAAATTEVLTGLLPPPLAAWFRSEPAFHDTVGLARADYATLRRLWPEGACAAGG
jgi:hypothetical protein